VVLKNPGSARPLSTSGNWEIIKEDHTLVLILNRFREAYAESQKVVPRNAFVQVWNLFYLCNHEADEAFATLVKYRESFGEPELCRCEDIVPKLVWFAWGKCNGCKKADVARFNSLKARFRKEQHKTHSCYYSPKASSMVEGVPSDSEDAQHPQGLPSPAIATYIANRLFKTE
jgi:hypothetical protein